jgi:phage baseplate assembly protein W
MTNFGLPLRIDGRGRVADADAATHLRDLIEQFLFTNLGERVNRPTFGSGLLQLVFAPNSDELAAALQFTIQGGLQQWLGDVATVAGVSVQVVDAALNIAVAYAPRGSSSVQVAQFTGSL